MVRFFRGINLLGQAIVQSDVPLAELAETAGVVIPTNCTSGTCGTCMMRLLSGNVTGLDPIPTALDEEWIADGAILSCISQIIGSSLSNKT